MDRNIVIVNATQVVTSEAHPEGMFSVMQGFPKTFDSLNYQNNLELTMKTAKSAYYDQLSKNYSYTNRAMTTVTLEMASGQQILHECIGAFPIIEEQEEIISPENIEENSDEGGN